MFFIFSTFSTGMWLAYQIDIEVQTHLQPIILRTYTDKSIRWYLEGITYVNM